MRTVGVLFFGLCVFSALAENPGEFRPKPVLHPAEKVGATGFKVQPPDTYPRSRAHIQWPARKPKLTEQPQPTIRGSDVIFNAGWEMTEASNVVYNGTNLSLEGIDTRNWYDATVPGTVLTTLVDEGVYPDPYFGLNNLAIPESLNKQDYWYRTSFILPVTFAGREMTLEFNGINYYAEVYFNGHYLGHITGAFRRGSFDVTKIARPDARNVLAVMIAPPPDPGIPSEQSVKFGPGDNGGALCLDGPTFVCSEGWDWIPAIRDRCAGIWQGVYLRASGAVRVVDPQVITQLPGNDLSRAELTINTEVHNCATTPEQGTVRAAFENVEVSKRLSLAPGETKMVSFTPSEFPQLVVQNPRLWWPNGYGKPELYQLTVSFATADGTESDSQQTRFGIRQLSYDLEVRKPDGQRERMEFTPVLARGSKGPLIDNRRSTMHWRENTWKEGPVEPGLWPGAEDSPALRASGDPAMGPYLVIRVNGKKILCEGGNWGMDDAMKRISRARLEPYIRMHRDANVTMIRNWSGQSTSEDFYDLCDEYGILVWNDFWMDTEGWNYVPYDHRLFLDNVADTIKRFRNHPSIAIWCAMNEGVPPEDINQGNDRLIRELDGTRYYQPNSRWVNLRVSGPWSNRPLADYFTNLNHGFSTEMGASSIPPAEVMSSMMAEPDLWPPGDVWAYHDFHSRGAGNRVDTLKMLSDRYGEARSLDDLCRKAQMLNYETYRAVYEGFNSRMWKDTSGVLVWMSHPSWPSVVWQFYSWDYEPNGALFGIKKAAEPLHIQMNLPDCKVVVVNRHSDPVTDANATATLYDLAGNVEHTDNATVNVDRDNVADAFTINWPESGAHLVRLQLHDKGGELLSDNFYWHARQETDLQQLNQLKPATLQTLLTVTTNDTGPVMTLSVTNAAKIPALALHLTARNAANNLRILPAFYGDDYFSLMPGETRTVQIEVEALPEKACVSLDGWNLPAVNVYPAL